MTRLRPLRRTDLEPDQAALYDEIVRTRQRGGTFDLFGRDGALAGPFNAMVHEPKLGRHWAALGERLRFHSLLGRRLVELVICIVGAHFRAEFEFQAHAPIARRAGVNDDVLDALRSGAPPQFERDDERAVYDVTVRLVAARQVPSGVYAAAEAAIGEAGMVELASLVGYYAALAMSLNLFRVGPPTGCEPIWPHA